MTTVSVKVEKNGRILIPAELRRKLGLKEGESEVVLQVDDDNILQLSTRRQALERLREKLKHHTGSLADELIAERRAEADPGVARMASQHLLDASAVLAMIKNEPAAGEVLELIEEGACIHSVNLVEVITKVRQAGGDAEDIRGLGLKVVSDLPVETAERCAWLHMATRAQGLSLGDCICLGVAAVHGWTAVTRDLAWVETGKLHGIDVRIVPLQPFPIEDKREATPVGVFRVEKKPRA